MAEAETSAGGREERRAGRSSGVRPSWSEGYGSGERAAGEGGGSDASKASMAP